MLFVNNKKKKVGIFILDKYNLETKEKTNSIIKTVRYYIYLILAELPLYVGETKYKDTRISNHLTNNSNLKTDYEALKYDYGMKSIIHIDITNYIQESNEVLFLEYLMIDHFDPLLNKRKSNDVCKRVSKERIDYLVSVFYDILLDFDNYESYDFSRNRKHNDL